MTTYLTDIMQRLVAMQRECITGADASLNPLHIQESYPYFVNTLGDGVFETPGYELARRTYTITIEYVLGQATEGYTDEVIRRMYEDEPTILDYFQKRPGLQSVSYPTRADYLDPVLTEFTRAGGVGRFLRRGGIGVEVIGTIFQLRAGVIVPIPPAYF